MPHLGPQVACAAALMEFLDEMILFITPTITGSSTDYGHAVHSVVTDFPGRYIISDLRIVIVIEEFTHGACRPRSSGSAKVTMPHTGTATLLELSRR